MCDTSQFNPVTQSKNLFGTATHGDAMTRFINTARATNVAKNAGMDPAGTYLDKIANPYIDGTLGINKPSRPQGDFTQEGYLRSHQHAFDDWASQYDDPTKYQQLLDQTMARSRGTINDQYGAVGMAGSGASIGAMNQSDRQTQFDSFQRQISDRSTIEQIRNMYSQSLTNIDVAKLNEANLNAAQDAQQKAALLSAVGTVAGAYFGGPMGAAAGSQAGKVVPGQNYAPITMPQSQFQATQGMDAYSGSGMSNAQYNSAAGGPWSLGVSGVSQPRGGGYAPGYGMGGGYGGYTGGSY